MTDTPDTIERIHPDLRHLAIPIGELNEDPANANQHNDASLEGIAASFTRFGQRKNIVVRREGMVIEAGNGTLAALKAAGWTHLACSVCDDDEDTAKAYALADNNRRSTWDMNQLAQNVGELLEAEYDLTGLWSDDELKVLADRTWVQPSIGIIATDDDQPAPDSEPADTVAELQAEPADEPEDFIPEPPAEPVTKFGDVIELGPHTLHCADCMDVLADMPDNSVDAIVCDPPYGLSPDGVARTWDDIAALRAAGKNTPSGGFMSANWDSGVPGISWARECLRVLKPGGHIVAFSATRTVHRLACAIEDAGFEIRDQYCHLQYCLADDVEILTDQGWATIDDKVRDANILCYYTEDGQFAWHKAEDRFCYLHDASVYRISGDHGTHRVTQGHRLVVERGSAYSFQTAQEAARERETHIPVVENLRALLHALSDNGPRPSGAIERLHTGLLKSGSHQKERPTPQTTHGGPSRDDANGVCGVFKTGLENAFGSTAKLENVLFKVVQREGTWSGLSTASKVLGRVVAGAPSESKYSSQGREQPSVERRNSQATQAQSAASGSAHSLPAGSLRNVAAERLRTPASTGGCTCNSTSADTDRNGTPRGPQPEQQRCAQPNALHIEQSTQTLRSTRHTRPDLVRIEREHYTGRVWCVKVPSGAFVARVRGGLPFITGNSGFPKSKAVGPAIDEMMGFGREVVSSRPQAVGFDTEHKGGGGGAAGVIDVTAPATDIARAHEGQGTALKPAIEPAVIARKPLDKIAPEEVADLLGQDHYWASNAAVPTAPESGDTKAVTAKRKASAELWGEVPAGAVVWRARPLRSTVQGRIELRVAGEVVATREGAKYSKAPLQTVALNVLKWGTGAYNIDACRHAPGDKAWPGPQDSVQSRGERPKGGASGLGTATTGQYDNPVSDLGRWPANVYHCPKPTTRERSEGTASLPEPTGSVRDIGGAQHTDGVQLAKNYHPTVKPLKVIRQLAKLVTPPGGTIFEPFGGSGTILPAVRGLGFTVILAEREPKYMDIVRARGEHSLRPIDDPPRRVLARPGDKVQARRRVQTLIDSGALPKPSDLECTDCGDTTCESPHEYDHYLGYGEPDDAPEAVQHAHETVQAVCALCHHKREAERVAAT